MPTRKVAWRLPRSWLGGFLALRSAASSLLAAFPYASLTRSQPLHSTPKAFDQIGWRYYLVFVICTFTNALTIWAFFPETKGRRLEEIGVMFKESSWFVPSHPPRSLNAQEVEREMREGKLQPGQATEHAATEGAFDTPMTKAEVEEEKLEHA